jgi:hypothetical protein
MFKVIQSFAKLFGQEMELALLASYCVSHQESICVRVVVLVFGQVTSIIQHCTSIVLLACCARCILEAVMSTNSSKVGRARKVADTDFDGGEDSRFVDCFRLFLGLYTI